MKTKLWKNSVSFYLALLFLGACSKDRTNEIKADLPQPVKPAEVGENLKIESLAFQRMGAEVELVVPEGARALYDVSMCEGTALANCVRLYRVDCTGDKCQLLHGTTLENRTNYYLLRRAAGAGKESIYIEDAVWVAFPLDSSFRAIALQKDGKVSGAEVKASTSSDISEPDPSQR